MREHLDVDDDRELLYPDAAAEAVRRTAAALEGWYAGGRRGPRPAGRLRPHTLPSDHGAAPAWSRLLAAPLYRAALDPDGRPLGMRLRRTQ